MSTVLNNPSKHPVTQFLLKVIKEGGSSVTMGGLVELLTTESYPDTVWTNALYRGIWSVELCYVVAARIGHASDDFLSRHMEIEKGRMDNWFDSDSITAPKDFWDWSSKPRSNNNNSTIRFSVTVDLHAFKQDDDKDCYFIKSSSSAVSIMQYRKHNKVSNRLLKAINGMLAEGSEIDIINFTTDNRDLFNVYYDYFISYGYEPALLNFTLVGSKPDTGFNADDFKDAC